MKGRFCVRSTDGYWLQIDRDGRAWYMTDPAPIKDARGRILEEGATSFFGKDAARAMMEKHSLFAADDPRRQACQIPPEPWEIVPDPNP